MDYEEITNTLNSIENTLNSIDSSLDRVVEKMADRTLGWLDDAILWAWRAAILVVLIEIAKRLR
jgi:hypothetical protein